MNECSGAIILGYPQIEIHECLIKGNKVENLLLGTEWNHIEAGLAYAKNMPILVIHQRDISRGIFDRGTLNSFVYSIDLTNPSWSLLPEVSGAFSNWKNKLHQYATKNEKLTVNQLISLLEKNGFNVELERRFQCGNYNAELAVNLIIDGKKTDTMRFTSITYAYEQTETIVNELCFRYKHWVFSYLTEENKNKLIRTLGNTSEPLK